MKNKIITIPNLLSFLRLCMIPLFMWLYCIQHDSQGTVGILLLSGATDIADGFIARKFHMTSDLGKILDPVADKATQAAMLFCLITEFPFMIVPLALLIVKEIYMGVTGALVIQKTGKVFGAEWHGKVATCLLDAMMIIHVIWHDIPKPVSNLFIVVCMIMMIISLILYGIRNSRAIREEKRVEEK